MIEGETLTDRERDTVEDRLAEILYNLERADRNLQHIARGIDQPEIVLGWVQEVILLVSCARNHAANVDSYVKGSS